MTISLALDAASVLLESWPLDPHDIIEGAPSTSGHILWESEDGRDQRGIWEITPGTVRDVEMDEIFVVLAGRATVTLEDGRSLDLAPGTVGMFRAGERAIWKVTETLRKVYQGRVR